MGFGGADLGSESIRASHECVGDEKWDSMECVGHSRIQEAQRDSAWMERKGHTEGQHGGREVLIEPCSCFLSLLCALDLWGRGSKTLLAQGSTDGLLLSGPFLPQRSDFCVSQNFATFIPQAGRGHWPIIFPGGANC